MGPGGYPNTASSRDARRPMWMDPPLRTPNLRFSPPSLQCERSANTASGSPLGGCVGVQHSGALHPCPNRVHAGHHGLFFHTTPAPLDALVDAKHQNAPLRSLCFFSLSLSSMCLYPPLLGSLLFSLSLPPPASPSPATVWSRCHRSKVVRSISLGV